MNAKQREQAEAKEHLLRIIKPGDTVYTSLRHVSRSGMYRVINLHVIRDNQPVNIDYWAARLLEGYDSRHGGCKVGGCGMDTGFHLVHNLGYALFPDGFDCVSEHCPSNDHVNERREHYRTLTYWPGYHHSSGGYALRHCWM